MFEWLIQKKFLLIFIINIGATSCMVERSSELSLTEPSPAKFPWLVKVSTTYKNGKSFKTYTGKGYIVRSGDRNFVISNAHLTSGSETKVLIRDSNNNWKRTEIIGKRSDSLLDISLLEVSSKLSPLAQLTVKKIIGPNLLTGNAKILEVVAKGFENADFD
ncbi:hypothetical protein N9D31_04235, partial [Oligoflexaceae bacterium]|nr:hypothetical protein [Oligoflexaceae bacterium]